MEPFEHPRASVKQSLEPSQAKVWLRPKFPLILLLKHLLKFNKNHVKPLNFNKFIEAIDFILGSGAARGVGVGCHPSPVSHTQAPELSQNSVAARGG